MTALEYLAGNGKLVHIQLNVITDVLMINIRSSNINRGVDIEALPMAAYFSRKIIVLGQ